MASTIATGSVLLAGCLDELFDDEIEAASEPAAVDPAVVDSLGFEHLELDDFGIDETFEIGDETVSLSATSWVSMYGVEEFDPEAYGSDPSEIEDVDEEHLLGAAVISTPSATFAGQEVNPAGWSDELDLVEQFDNELVDGGVDSIEQTDTIPITVLDESVELSVFEADLAVDDVDDTVPVIVYLAIVELEDDFILPAGVHHRSVDAIDDLIELFEAIEYPVDSP